MAKGKQRISVDGGGNLGSNPFGSLDSSGLAAGGSEAAGSERSHGKPTEKRKSRGRLEVRRETGGRGGKTVTVVSGFLGISAEEKLELAKSVQRRCGVGGSVKEGRIELQGDQREAVREILDAAGFKVVFAGG